MTRLDWLATLPAGSRGAELGVFRGVMAAAILRIVRPCQLYLVDAWRQQEEGNDVDRAATTEWHQGNREVAMRRIDERRAATDVQILQMQTTEAAAHVADGLLDWVYIDADHTFNGVYGDLCAWWPKVKSGGVVAGHDYLPSYHGQSLGPKGQKAMRESEDDGSGVMGAVAAFRRERDLEDVALNVTEEWLPTFWFVKP